MSHRTPWPPAQPVSGPWATVAAQSKPPAETTDVGTVFEVLVGSNDPPPVSRTAPVGNALTLPLKPEAEAAELQTASTGASAARLDKPGPSFISEARGCMTEEFRPAASFRSAEIT